MNAKSPSPQRAVFVAAGGPDVEASNQLCLKHLLTAVTPTLSQAGQLLHSFHDVDCSGGSPTYPSEERCKPERVGEVDSPRTVLLLQHANQFRRCWPGAVAPDLRRELRAVVAVLSSLKLGNL